MICVMSYGNYPDLNGIKKILVIKLRHLGDVLLSAPVFSSLKNQLPSAQIDAYVYKEAAAMLEGHPAIRQLIFYDRKWKKLSLFHRMRKEIQLLLYLRKQNYDLIINLTEGDRGAFVCKISNAKILVGYDEGKKSKRKVYTHLVKICPGLRHTVERNLDCVRKIGIFPQENKRALYFSIPDDVTQKMTHLLQKKDFSDFYLIHPLARWRFKCWPTEKMRRLILTLLENNEKVVLVAGNNPEEKKIIDEIVYGISHPHFLNLCSQLSLKELGACIQLSKALICVDSVCFHMANALKAKTYALFGPTSDVTWGAWQNPNAHIITKNLPCRPCYMDGCGGSKMADCLYSLEFETVIKALQLRVKNNFEIINQK